MNYKNIITYKTPNGKTQKTTTGGKNDFTTTIRTLKKLNFKILDIKNGLSKNYE